MSKSDIAVAVCESHGQAEVAVHKLAKAGFDIETLSITGKVLRYETALKADKFLVIVHGVANDMRRAREVLTAAGSTGVQSHAGPHEVRARRHPRRCRSADSP